MILVMAHTCLVRRWPMITDSLLNEYSRMFVSRRDDYAIQQLNGRYLRVGSPLTKIALLNHLNGAQSLGTYVIDERGRCRFAVFDADAHHGLDVLLGMQGQMALDGIPSYLERSRRGGHLWVLLQVPVLASHVRSWLLPYCPVGVEFYPKQDEGNGYGSLIRLPLGVHLLSGCRYPFVEWMAGSLVEVAPTINEMIEWLCRKRAGRGAGSCPSDDCARSTSRTRSIARSRGPHTHR